MRKESYDQNLSSQIVINPISSSQPMEQDAMSTSSQANTSQDISQCSPAPVRLRDKEGNDSQVNQPKKCDNCKKGRLKKDSTCQTLCRKCCLEINKGTCKGHKYHKKLAGEQFQDHKVFILDFETTNLKGQRGITDCYILNIQNNETLKFENYVLPRMPIQLGAAEVTGITTEKVANGDPEKVAVQKICHFVQGKSIIVAHNANFDKETFVQAYNHWSKSDPNFGFKQDTELIFLDSKPIFGNRLKALNILCSDLQLGTIYEATLKKKIQNQHTATADVLAISEIMQIVFSSEKSYSEHWKTCLKGKIDLKTFLLVFKSKKLLPDCDLTSNSRYLLN